MATSKPERAAKASAWPVTHTGELLVELAGRDT